MLHKTDWLRPLARRPIPNISFGLSIAGYLRVCCLPRLVNGNVSGRIDGTFVSTWLAYSDLPAGDAGIPGKEFPESEQTLWRASHRPGPETELVAS